MKRLNISNIVASVFDAGWYRQQLAPSIVRTLQTRNDLLNHYLQHGASDALSPNPLFAPEWYAECNDIPAEQAFTHYVTTSLRRGGKTVRPHPLFIIEAWDRFLRQHKAATLTGVALVDFMRVAGYDAAAVCPFFDEIWYRSYYGSVADAFRRKNIPSGFYHYLRQGEEEGRRANPYFHENWFAHTIASAQPDMAFRAYADDRWKCNDPSPLFSETRYHRINPGVADAIEGQGLLNGFEHFLKLGAAKGLSVTATWNEAQYRRLNPDACENLGTAALPSALAHYALQGASDGRDPNVGFDEIWYRNSYPEAASLIANGVLNSGYEHFVWRGEALGRAPRIDFCPNFYRLRYADVAERLRDDPAFSLTAHYFNTGLKEGRTGHSFANPITKRILDTAAAPKLRSGQRPGKNLCQKLADIDFFTEDGERNYYKIAVRALPFLQAHRQLAEWKLATFGGYAAPARIPADATWLLADLTGRALGRKPNATTRRLRSAANAQPASVNLDLEQDTLQIVRHGRSVEVYLSGICNSLLHAIERIEFRCGGFRQLLSLRPALKPSANLPAEILRRHFADTVRFASMISIPERQLSAAKSAPYVEVRHRQNGKRQTARFELEIGRIIEVTPPEIVADTPTVAICMAMYNPSIEAMSRQLQTIREQTYQDWICLISDESTREDHLAALEELTAGDPRFIVRRHDDRNGFMRNFERTLMGVPDGVRYICLADQDDVWYPEKVARLVSEIDRNGAELVYSDMDVLDSDGQRRPESLLGARIRSHENWYDTLFANSVTGAAAIFRRELLDLLLPFPAVPYLYHDHWIATVAATVGRIVFCDEKLYGYVQHEDNVLGAGRTAEIEEHRHVHDWIDALTKSRAGQNAAIAGFAGRQMAYEYHRNLLLFQALARRCKGRLNRRLPAGRFLENDDFDGLLDWLARYRPDPKDLIRVGGDARCRLAKQADRYLAKHPRWISDVEIARHHNHDLDRSLARYRLADVGGQVTVHDLARKTELPNLRRRSRSARRIVFLLPELVSRHFFGGYMGKFNLIAKLLDIGHRVEIVCVEQTALDPEDLLRIHESFPELGRVLIEANIRPGRDFLDGVRIGPNDTVIATTWWTAHMANALIQLNGAERFIYLIQEYEPFTFVMGSWAAVAHESYGFPHQAIFSSDLLCRHFEAQRIGVFADGETAGRRRSLVMNNAIHHYDDETVTAARRSVRGRKKRLFIYARPEQHAARNMYEVAIAAVARAVRHGLLDPSAWEIFGLGSPADSVELAGLSMTMLGKMRMDEYHALLPGFDLALALMYTPHPSLVPLELAAAGVPTITTSCGVKTATAMRRISPHFIVAEPTVDGVYDAIGAGLRHRPGMANQVDWPQDWSQVFDRRFAGRLSRWIEANRPSTKR